MRDVGLDLDDTLDIQTVQIDVATGIAHVDGEYVRLVHVLAARSYTVPLAYETTQDDALRLAAAIIEWDCGMMEAADTPFDAKGPKLVAKQTIRSFLPRMHPCELRDLFVETHGYAGALR